MDAIQIYDAQAPAPRFDPATINDFVSWIDRSEKTTRAYLTNLRQFAAWMQYKGIQAPVRDDIISYRQWLQTEHDAIMLDPGSVDGWKYRTDKAGMPIRIVCSANTAAQYLRSVCQFFRWAAACGIYPDVAANIHAPKLRHDTHRKDALTAAEVQAIETSITAQAAQKVLEAQEAQKDAAGREQRGTVQGLRLRAMYLLAVTAGLRCVEISRANVADLETKGGQAVLWIWGKGHSEPDQRKPLAPEVASAIREYIGSRTDHPTGASPLFVSTGNRSGGRRIAATTISKMLKAAMQAAGYDSPRITAHSLRHTCGTAVMQVTGGNLFAAQTYMRHSNPTTTEIYLHTDTEQQEAQTAQMLYDHFHGTGGADRRGQLEQIVARMTPAQLEQLAGIAAAMA